MFAGQIITYTVSPILGIPLFWMTEITHVREREYFIDEQRFGPYALWHHKHFFRAVPGGTEMTDLLDYKLPLGFLGNIAHALFVQANMKKYMIIAILLSSMHRSAEAQATAAMMKDTTRRAGIDTTIMLHEVAGYAFKDPRQAREFQADKWNIMSVLPYLKIAIHVAATQYDYSLKDMYDPHREWILETAISALGSSYDPK
ncbi:unnamed protein product [Sphagnum jensenii]|uniref:Uncharacterized protein n=1 Tax=Sphagnum jensenii TaxID=128206 RepID=A0ABP0VEX4_9BRYO